MDSDTPKSTTLRLAERASVRRLVRKRIAVRCLFVLGLTALGWLGYSHVEPKVRKLHQHDSNPRIGPIDWGSLLTSITKLRLASELAENPKLATHGQLGFLKGSPHLLGGSVNVSITLDLPLELEPNGSLCKLPLKITNNSGQSFVCPALYWFGSAPPCAEARFGDPLNRSVLMFGAPRPIFVRMRGVLAHEAIVVPSGESRTVVAPRDAGPIWPVLKNPPRTARIRILTRGVEYGIFVDAPYCPNDDVLTRLSWEDIRAEDVTAYCAVDGVFHIADREVAAPTPP